jgi:hypothetical protein
MTFKRKEVIGDCTLYLGDCLEIMPTLGKVDDQPDMFVSAPAPVLKQEAMEL